jgi:ABC-type glycerol-3-phosphate transport system permease component
MSRPSILHRLLTVHLPALLVVLLAIGPFAWLLLTALTPSAAITATGVSLSPAGWSLANFDLAVFLLSDAAGPMTGALVDQEQWVAGSRA